MRRLLRREAESEPGGPFRDFLLEFPEAFGLKR